MTKTASRSRRAGPAAEREDVVRTLGRGWGGTLARHAAVGSVAGFARSGVLGEPDGVVAGDAPLARVW